MISVINTEPEVISNPFPGMNLAEACNAAEISVMEIMNEFHMGVLLTEHAYLYENGVEIEYVDEAGNLNERAANLKATAIEAVKAAGRWVAEMFDKALQWVIKVAGDVKIAMKKAGIRPSDVSYIANNFDSVFSDGPIPLSVNCIIDDKFFKEDSLRDAMKNEKQVNENRVDPYEKYVTVEDNTIDINKEVFNTAWANINDKRIINSIKEAKRNANQRINDKITEIKKVGHEDMNEEIAGLKGAMKANAKATTSLIKVYHAYMNQQIAIVRAVMNSPKGRAVIRVGRKDAVKAAPGKAKEAAKGVAKSTASAVTAAPGKAKNAVVSAPSKAREAIENAKDEIEFRKISNNVKKFNKNVEKQEKKQAKEEAKGAKEKKHFVNPLKKK